jgi:transcriptional regulator with XRE-family HTH domain
LGVPVDTIAHYEFGQLEIPLHQLETLAGYLNISLDFFMDQGIASQDDDLRGATLDEIAQFSQLPADVREFISNPANLLYIHIAMKISNVPADTLRGLAEGLLEVTY